jgi:thioredoxin-like negative regulator of GroEL
MILAYNDKVSALCGFSIKLKKAIDAEQFENAKSTLKSIIKSDPSEGKAYFLLEKCIFGSKVADSAK